MLRQRARSESGDGAKSGQISGTPDTDGSQRVIGEHHVVGRTQRERSSPAPGNELGEQRWIVTVGRERRLGTVDVAECRQNCRPAALGEGHADPGHSRQCGRAQRWIFRQAAQHLGFEWTASPGRSSPQCTLQ